MNNIFPMIVAEGGGFLESQVGAALVSGGTAIVAFFFGQHFERAKERRREWSDYHNALQLTQHELEFHVERFLQLSKELTSLAEQLRNGVHYVVPSYTLYAASLEHFKMLLGGFLRNSDLVKAVGECHFELSHIIERLDFTKEQCGKAIGANVHLICVNVEGFNTLVKENISRFRDVIDKIREERGACHDQLNRFQDTFLGSLLKE